MADQQKPGKEGDSSQPVKRQAIPFEPRKEPRPASSEKSATSTTKGAKAAPPKFGKAKQTQPRKGNIPEVVSRRMVQRVALFSGIPTAFGMSSFILSYLAVSQGWMALPTYVVLFVSAGWFGLGVMGVSYGVLSASWDEDTAGSLLGFTELKTNWARMTEAWRSQNQQRRDSSK